MKIDYNFTDEELKKEIWVSIPYYEGLYEASNLGRIRTALNKKTNRNINNNQQERIWKQRILKPKCCLSTRLKIRYDARVELWKDGKHKTFLVARLILASFNHNYDLFSSMTANHIDNNSLNNRIKNLEWCSRADNIKKGFETGAYHYPKIKITDKNNNETYIFNSKAKASIYIGKNISYISSRLIKNRFENDNYKWEIIK